MGFIAAAAAAAVVGAGVSAYGASQNAKAVRSAANKARAEEEALYERWSGRLDDLISDKEERLYNMGNIFDRFESTGAFGTDTRTLENFRKAQADFSALAAGDFTGFESQLRKSMSDALVNTVGSGSPIGAYAGLAADTQLQYRLQGLQTATGITDFLAGQTQNLLGMEFGIMDQEFETGYTMDRNRISQQNQARQQAAQTEGVSTMALGQGISQIGSALGSYGSYMDSRNFQQQQFGLQSQYMGGLTSSPSAQYSPSYTNYSPQSIPSFSAPIPTYTPSSIDYPDGIPTMVPALPSGSSYTASDALLPPRTTSYTAPSQQSTSASSGGFWSNIGRAYVSSSPLAQIGAMIASGVAR